MKIEKEKIKNILIIRRRNIGDMICAIPFFRTIRSEFPNAHITIVADEMSSNIIETASFVDEVLVYRRGKCLLKNKHLNYWKLLRQSKRDYDLAIALKTGFSSLLALVSCLSRATIRVGCVSEKWHPLQICYNMPIAKQKRWSTMHIVDSLLDFSKNLGIQHAVRDMSIEIPKASEEKVEAFFKSNRLEQFKAVVVFNISNTKPENTWPLESFKELGSVLVRDYNAACIVTSTLSDRGKAAELSTKIGSRAFCFYSPQIMEFAALVARADLLICGEGGAMHIGAGVNTPTISLWSKSRPVKWYPFGDKQYVVKKDEDVKSIGADDILKVMHKNKLLQE